MPNLPGKTTVVITLPEGRAIIDVRPDLPPLAGGGRSGEFVKNLTGPPNSALRSAAPGRAWVTNSRGQVILDITKERTKTVQPGIGFGEKRPPTGEEFDLLLRLGIK